jgi:hypothetical protein
MLELRILPRKPITLAADEGIGPYPHSGELTSAVRDPSWPILASFTPIPTPGASAGTRKTAIPGLVLVAAAVRATRRTGPPSWRW